MNLLGCASSGLTGESSIRRHDMLANVDVQQVQKTEVHCANGTPAFLARPGKPGDYPVMVVLHERYGLLDHTRDVATRFATHGHIAIAPAIFWREPDLEAIAKAEARAEVSDEPVCEDIASALEFLKTVEGAD